MLHNKYFEILEQFLGDYGKEIHGRGLIGKVSLSQKGIALALDDLEKNGVLISQKKGNMKFFKLNKRHSEICDLLISVEIRKKIKFMNTHRKIATIFNFDSRVVGIFGSYARGTQKMTSDLDIFIIGTKRKDDYRQKGNLFDLEVSVKYFTEKEFKKLLKEGNSLIKEIIKDHICIFGVEKFIQLLWGEFYGDN
jgi:predicted nucleotidyltransferase